MIDINSFKGLAPSIEPVKLGEGLAQTANNCKFDSGALESELGNLPTLLSGHTSLLMTTHSLFPYVGHYIYADNPRTYLRTPNEGDVHERLYFIEEGGEPRFYAGGVVGATYKLGLPRPELSGTPYVLQGAADGDNEDLLSEHYRSYIIAWVDNYGHLGPTSEPFTVVEPLFTGAEVRVYRPELLTGEYDMGLNAKYRIYRSNTGNSGSAVYQYVADVPFNINFYVDTKESGDLQEAAVSTAWEAPPALEDFVAMPGGFFAGFKDNAIYFSEPYLPHAWPYKVSYTENIVGISVIDSGLLVLTDDKPYLMVGSTPQAMGRVDLRSDQSCVSKKSIVDMGGATIWASTDGLCIAYGTEVKIITEGLLHRDDWWADFDPANIEALVYEGKYVSHHFTFDPKAGLNALVMGEQVFDAHYRDGLSDKTYMVDPVNGIVELKTGDPLVYQYKTRKYEYPAPVNFGSLKIDIEAGTGSVVVTCYGDGVAVFSGTLTSSGTYKLPAGYKARYYEVSFTGTATVNRMQLKTSNQGRG